MYNLSTKAHQGPQQPTTAHACPRRWGTGRTTQRYVLFLLYNLFFIFYINSRLHHTHHTPLWRGRQPRKPTKAPAANEGPSSQQRPTQAHEEGKGPINLFFLIMFFFIKFTTYPRKPTKAHSSQRRPTKMENGP